MMRDAAANHIVRRHHLAMMEIGDQPDAETVERRGKGRYGHRRTDDLNLMARIREPVGAAPDGRANAARQKRIERRAPADQHARMIMDPHILGHPPLHSRSGGAVGETKHEQRL